MSGLTVKTQKNMPESPKASSSHRADVVGEIDTSAPFQSVKAAVSLFGDPVSPRASAPATKKSKAEERVLEKETQHSLILKELECYKEQLKNAEAARAQAQRDLQRANRTLQQLTNKLETLSESKRASMEATEAAKIRLKELEEQRSLRAQRGSDAWKEDIEIERDAYKACTGELATVRQEVSNLRQVTEAALQEKLDVVQKMEDAQRTAQLNQEKQSLLLQELMSLREELDQLKLSSLQAEEDYSRIVSEKESCLLACKSAKAEAEKEIERLREEDMPKEVLEQKLAETMEAVTVLQDQLNEIQASDLNSIKTMASELDSAKKKLQEVVAEETSIRSTVESIKQQLEEVKKERAESEHKTLKAEAAVRDLQAELEKKEIELEAAVSKCGSASLKKLSAEAERARQETQEYKKSAELLKQEAEAARTQTKEAENNLNIALKEAEEAKAAQKLAEEQMHNHALAGKADGLENLIRLPVEEFESMKKKTEDFGSQTEIKVATAMAQIESINTSKKEASQKLQEVLKENEALQSEINDTLKRIEMADAAKREVETELQKWRTEQNEAGESSDSPKSK
ncbi:WEB family protein At1g12150-like [Andrographis paniculata]|uniref:WEB family protein At1g12150-like n=1 Tax=Andrographis paniculata TaxID=175694 RepID=UPI0021E97ABB|nr:WEB family protein At1g12150-like [Andrographis paniculata]